MFIHAKLILHFINVEANMLFIKNEQKQKKKSEKKSKNYNAYIDFLIIFSLSKNCSLSGNALF